MCVCSCSAGCGFSFIHVHRVRCGLNGTWLYIPCHFAGANPSQKDIFVRFVGKAEI